MGAPRSWRPRVEPPTPRRLRPRRRPWRSRQSRAGRPQGLPRPRRPRPRRRRPPPCGRERQGLQRRLCPADHPLARSQARQRGPGLCNTGPDPIDSAAKACGPTAIYCGLTKLCGGLMAARDTVIEEYTAQLQACMYQYSRAIYRSIKDLIDPYVAPELHLEYRRAVLEQCEQTMERLAKDPLYFAKPDR